LLLFYFISFFQSLISSSQFFVRVFVVVAVVIVFATENSGLQIL
jgi:hypothetical protein